jgi:predicted ATPase
MTARVRWGISSGGDRADCVHRASDHVAVHVQCLCAHGQDCHEGGREFTLELLERVADMAAVKVAESLEPAIAAHIIEETSSIGRYSLALIRETIYEHLSRTRRAQLHRMIAEAIESVAGETAAGSASELAYHFSQAGDARKAYEYHAIAAAQRVYAVEPALAQYAAALEAAAERGLEPGRDSALRNLLLQRGGMRYRTGDHAGSAADFEAALGGAGRSDDRVIEMETLNELGIMQLRSNLAAAGSSHQAALEIA